MSKRERTTFASVLKQARILTVEHKKHTAVRKEKRGCTIFVWEDKIETHRFYTYSKALAFLKGLEGKK